MVSPSDGEAPRLDIKVGMKDVKAVRIENLPDERASEGLSLLLTDDDKTWDTIWEAETWQQEWLIPVTHFHAGIDVPGRRTWMLRLVARDGLQTSVPLKRVTVYGS